MSISNTMEQKLSLLSHDISFSLDTLTGWQPKNFCYVFFSKWLSVFDVFFFFCINSLYCHNIIWILLRVFYLFVHLNQTYGIN